MQCSADDNVGYENFRHVCQKWHYKITRALVQLLESKDYMQIRNALIILMRILPSFPVLSKLSQYLEKCVNKVIEEEKNHRQDLFVLATSYIGQLKSKVGDMMKEADFHQVSDKPVKNSQDSMKVVGNSSKVVNGNGTSSGKHESNHGMYEIYFISSYFFRKHFGDEFELIDFIMNFIYSSQSVEPNRKKCRKSLKRPKNDQQR